MKKITYKNLNDTINNEWDEIQEAARDLHQAVKDFSESYPIQDDNESLTYLLGALKEVMLMDLEEEK